jgi:hypothetical protein
MFSHPNFVRGQSHLLVHIERKSNPKKKAAAGTGGDDDDSDSAEHMPMHQPAVMAKRAFSDPTSSSTIGTAPNAIMEKMTSLETRLLLLERKLERFDALESEVDSLKRELDFKKLSAAQQLLSLAPDIAKKRVASSSPVKDQLAQKDDPMMSTANVKMEKSLDDNMLANLAPPRKVTRLTSVDSVFEMKDFPFEDTSSLGSVSMKDLMRELQTGIFSDFDEFYPAAPSKFGSMTRSTSGIVQQEVSSTVPTSDPQMASVSSSGSESTSEKTMCGKDRDEMFNIPHGYELQPGVTPALLKQAFSVIARMCCPQSGVGPCSEALRKMCDEHPHPSTLPPVEICPVSRELLPVLREGVQEEATDLAMMRAARQVYEVYYHTMMKKLQDKSSTSAAPCVKNMSASGAHAASSASQ